MNSCGESGAAVASAGRGAGVSKISRTRENTLLCGEGSVTSAGLYVSTSQTSLRRDRAPLPEEGSAEEG